MKRVLSRRLLASVFAAVVLLVHAAGGRVQAAEGAPGLCAPSELAVGTGERVVVRTHGAQRAQHPRLGHGPQPLLATLPAALALAVPAASFSLFRCRQVAQRPAPLATGRSSRGPPAARAG
jgi:hypothetical protein